MAASRLLLSYCVTGKDIFLRRMANSVAQQAIMDQRLPAGAARPDKALMTDIPREKLPESIRAAFGDNIATVPPPYVVAYGRSRFCLSKFRNASIDHALAHGYEWMMLCDCDTVLADDDFDPGDSRFAVPNVYWQTRQDETIDESLRAIRAGGQDAYSKGNSWFTLHRDLMQRVRFNEGIYGYGWEDVDFDHRARACGYKPRQIGTVLIHIFHPTAERAIESTLSERNKAIVKATEALIRKGVNVAAPPQIDVAFAAHPDWASTLCFVVDRERLHMTANNDWAGYSFNEQGNLIVAWDKWDPEEFRLERGIYRFVRRVKGSASP